MEQQLLNIYPSPELINYDKIKVFNGKPFQNYLIQNKYYITVRKSTT